MQWKNLFLFFLFWFLLQFQDLKVNTFLKRIFRKRLRIKKFKNWFMSQKLENKTGFIWKKINKNHTFILIIHCDIYKEFKCFVVFSSLKKKISILFILIKDRMNISLKIRNWKLQYLFWFHFIKIYQKKKFMILIF